MKVDGNVEARPSPLRSPDFLSALFWLAIGVYIAMEGWDLELGTLSEPGSGFILFWIGAAMIALSVALAVTTLIGGGGATVGQLWQNPRWRKVGLLLFYLVVYTIVLEPLGFIISTVILLILLFKTVEPQSWTTAIVGALVTTALTYIVFGIGLGTQFPDGIFGFR
jgi:putative tricarboxylic transport membrane protein